MFVGGNPKLCLLYGTPFLTSLIRTYSSRECIVQVLHDVCIFRNFLDPVFPQARLCELYERELREGNGPSDPPTGVFSAASESGRKRWADLKSRVVEHNIRIMAKYYTRLSLSRMAELLALSENETEEFLSSMVVKGTVEAKTDRVSEEGRKGMDMH